MGHIAYLIPLLLLHAWTIFQRCRHKAVRAVEIFVHQKAGISEMAGHGVGGSVQIN